MGSPGHPGSGKSRLGENSPFSSQICPTKHACQHAQRFFATPKPACGGPCGQKSAGRPSIPSKPNLEKNHRFPAKFAPPNARAGARSSFWRPRNPLAGVPADKQTLRCRPQCPNTPCNQYGTPPWVPWGTLGPTKAEKMRISAVCGA